MPSKEQVYEKQLRELGIWEEAFAPLVKDLSQAERQRTRAQKEWSEKAKREAEEEGRDPVKAKPSFSDELWAVICDLDKKILAYREALGLTPKALRRLRGQPTAAAGPTAAEEISAKLDRMLEQEDAETSWSYEALAEAAGLDGGPPRASAPTGEALGGPPRASPPTGEAMRTSAPVSGLDTGARTPSTAEAVPLPQTPQAAGGGKGDG